jgi:hypothetical protein
VLPHEEDDSHASLGFDPQHRSLFTHPLAPDTVCLHLDLPTLTLVLRRDSKTEGKFPLAGETLESALDWGGGQLNGSLPPGSSIRQRKYADFPESPLMQGAVFQTASAAALGDLANWFGNGLELLEGLRNEHPEMSPTRVWPHHFDLGAIVPLPGGADRMIGVGLSPGDRSYGQPYFYCSPYPQPASDARLPNLPLGHWHTADFVSAVLTAEELQACPSQSHAAPHYLAGAMAACHLALE